MATSHVATTRSVSTEPGVSPFPKPTTLERPTPRPYQQEAINRGYKHLSTGSGNNFICLPTGSGKSVVIAGIADMLEGSVLVLQPTAEILMQNWRRMRSYGYQPAMYSASVGRKQIAHITFAMVGSAINNIEHFLHFDHIIIDECHLVPEGEKAPKNSKPKRKEPLDPKLENNAIVQAVLKLQGEKEEEQEKDARPMYHRLVHAIQAAKGKPVPILGLTATPYRLTPKKKGAVVKFLGRSYPKFWDKLTYAVQISKLRDDGHLARLQYFRHKGIDPAQLVLNSTGSDYTDASVRAAFEAGGMTAKIVNIVDRLLKADRKRILVFTKFVEEAEEVAKFIPGARVIHGETPKAERQEILSGFDNGDIQVVCNVGVLTTGYDNPRLDTIVLARPTRSLSLYYQMVGRVMRPHPEKETGWVIDMVSLKDTFGEVEDLMVELDDKRLPIITGLIENTRTKQKVRVRLTNPEFIKHQRRNGERNYGSLANVR